MFKAKVTVVGMLGDTEKYPCAFGHKIGDEIIFDGESIHGKICPDVLPSLIPEVIGVMYGGPRYRNPGSFALWKYQGVRKIDPSMKKYDGFGFKPQEEYKEPPYHMRLGSVIHSVPGMGPKAKKRIDLTPGTQCPDSATMVLFKIEPYGLTDSGSRHLPYYRRQLSIAEKVKAKPGIEVNKVFDEFTEWEKKEIYPVLCPPLVEEALEELALAGYVEIRDGKAYPIKDLPQR
jgi:uncharacterized repeat protein (TIGR04076 family)